MAEEKKFTAIVGARVHTVSGPVHEPGTVIIEGEKIIAVGPEDGVKVPEGAVRLEARGMTLVPGLIEAHAHIGVFNEAQGEDNWDGNEMTDPVTPELRVIDALNPHAIAFPDVLAAGVTTVATMPGSANVIGGTLAAIRTRGTTVNDLVRAYPVGMKMALGYNPKLTYGEEQKKRPATRMANAAVLRGALTEAKNYAAKKLHHGAQVMTMEKKPADKREPVAPFEVNLKHEALLPVLEGKLIARLHCHRADDILTALRIRDEFGLEMALEHCTEGYKVAAELAKAGVTCVVGPHFIGLRYKSELLGINPANAAVLHAAGVRVCIQTDAVWGVQWLANNAALCVRYGLSPEEALKTITLNPAELLGLDKELGSIEEGKRADLLLVDGDPLDIRSKVVQVWLDGQPQLKEPR